MEHRSWSSVSVYQRCFIPTRMGNTSPMSLPQSLLPVHPHTHGEHISDVLAPIVVAGSSPHAWGTRLDQGPFPLVQRFIPTRMGNTACSFFRISWYSVHPHTHGEHIRNATTNAPTIGSSPHAWGTLLSTGICGLNWRFIPTRMGNTSPRTLR